MRFGITAWPIELTVEENSRDRVFRYQRRWLNTLCQYLPLRWMPKFLRVALAREILAKKAQAAINQKYGKRRAEIYYGKA